MKTKYMVRSQTHTVEHPAGPQPLPLYTQIPSSKRFDRENLFYKHISRFQPLPLTSFLPDETEQYPPLVKDLQILINGPGREPIIKNTSTSYSYTAQDMVEVITYPY